MSKTQKYRLYNLATVCCIIAKEPCKSKSLTTNSRSRPLACESRTLQGTKSHQEAIGWTLGFGCVQCNRTAVYHVCILTYRFYCISHSFPISFNAIPSITSEGGSPKYWASLTTISLWLKSAMEHQLDSLFRMTYFKMTGIAKLIYVYLTSL